MAIVWCSPSPRKHPQRSQEQQEEEEGREEDENVRQLQDCAPFYKCLEYNRRTYARDLSASLCDSISCGIGAKPKSHCTRAVYHNPSWSLLCIVGLGFMVLRTSVNKVPVMRKILPEEDSEEKFVTYKLSEKRPRKDCLVKTDRNWRACQKEVKALKECHNAKVKKQAPSSKPVTVSQ